MKKKIPFRKQIGFTQDVYALYLGISKGLLSLVELGLRSFTTSATSKNTQLYLRWLAFEKEFVPSPPDQESIETARKALEKKLDKLNFEKTKRLRLKETEDDEVIDYQKANAFLQLELDQNEQPDDVLYLDLTRRQNKEKLNKNSLLSSVEESLQDRFLDFQIAEYEKSLIVLDQNYL